MGKNKKTHAGMQGHYSRLAHLPSQGIVSAIGVVVDIRRRPGSDLMFQIQDESGKLSVVVRRAAADSMRLLEAGDVFCVNHTMMGLLGDDPAIIFNGYQRKGNFSSVWSGKRAGFTPKITTNEKENEDVPPVLEKRISHLRELFSGEAIEAAEDDSDGMLAEMMENQRHLVMINQACGMNPPPLPPRLEGMKDHLTSLIVNLTPTARFINDIHKVTNGSQDTFLNLFAQVVSIHKTQSSFTLRVWDGTEPIGLEELPRPSMLDVSEDWLKVDPVTEEAISPFLLNIICYGTSWEEDFLGIEPFDILLFANLHLSRRSLGDLSLAMHEGMSNRRCVAILPSEHNKAVDIRRRCEAKLLKLRPIVAPEEPENLEEEAVDDLSNLLHLAEDGNETVKTWHTSSQSSDDANATLSECVVEENDNESGGDAGDSLLEPPAVVAIPIQNDQPLIVTVDPVHEELPVQKQKEPMQTEEIHAEEGEAAEPQPMEAGEEADEELYTAIFKSGLSCLYRNPTWTEEVNLAYSLPLHSNLNFYNCLKVDLKLWQREQDSLFWTEYCNACSAQIIIQAGQNTWCPGCFTKDGRLSQCDVTLRVLVPLKTTGKRLLLAAFPQTLLKDLHPDITTLSDSRCTTEFNKHSDREWTNEVLSELQKPAVVNILNDLYCSSTIQHRRDDVCILFITKAVSQDQVARTLTPIS